MEHSGMRDRRTRISPALIRATGGKRRLPISNRNLIRRHVVRLQAGRGTFRALAAFDQDQPALRAGEV
jgi:hypothetical protein